ncbi:MAG: hypothetical protein MRY83_04580, partial [Flavobacteriales bacterium]|nr:hypothetical protein [Flavobacteriales bacterium]
MPREQHIFILLFFVLFSCQNTEEEQIDDPVLAKVHNKSLYLSQIQGGVPKGISEEDSVALIKTFIKHWIEDELVISGAQNNKNIDIEQIDKQVAGYKKSLLVFAYENEEVKAKLDTIVSGQEISKYYLDNEADFILKDHIVKLAFIAVSDKSKNKDEIRKNYRLKSEESLGSLQNLIGEFVIFSL